MAGLTLRSPTEDDLRLVRGIIERHEAQRPAGIVRVDFTFSEDWAGGPAVYIDLIADRDIEQTFKKAREFNDFAKLIHDDIIDSQLDFRPYSRTFVER